MWEATHQAGLFFYSSNPKGVSFKEPTPFLFSICAASLVSVGKTGTEGGFPTGTLYSFLVVRGDELEKKIEVVGGKREWREMKKIGVVFFACRFIKWSACKNKCLTVRM